AGWRPPPGANPSLRCPRGPPQAAGASRAFRLTGVATPLLVKSPARNQGVPGPGLAATIQWNRRLAFATQSRLTALRRGWGRAPRLGHGQREKGEEDGNAMLRAPTLYGNHGSSNSRAVSLFVDAAFREDDLGEWTVANGSSSTSPTHRRTNAIAVNA